MTLVTRSIGLDTWPTHRARNGKSIRFGHDNPERPDHRDPLGRNLSRGGPLGTVAHTYDAAGRCTQLTAANGYVVGYQYLVTGEVSAELNGVGEAFATFGYDDRGRRASRSLWNGSGTTYTYDNVSRLTQMVENLVGTSHDLTLDFTPNPAGQMHSVVRSNDAFSWAGHYAVNRSYTADGLNRYTAIGSITPTYNDARGNLTSAGSTTYSYDSSNRLVASSSGAALVYDPLGRLYEVSAGGSTRRLVYDGATLIGEYDGAGNVRNFYLHGPGVDEPLVWFDPPASTFGTYLADERGSVIATVGSAGAVTAINTYDEYGIPGGGNAGRFQYTGQIWLAELGMYYYKARIYSPTLGRFMQTDPIGYQGGTNLYGYVGNDPLNRTDPSGLRNCHPGDQTCIETPESEAQPGDPAPVPSETQETDEIVVQAQGLGHTTDGEPVDYPGSLEEFFAVTNHTFRRRPMPQHEIECGDEAITIGRPAPLGDGERAAHSHTDRQNNSTGSVPGPGDNNFGNRPTGYMITSTHAFAMDRGPNGTFRTRVIAGGPPTATQRAQLIENMQNWESGNSSNTNLTERQRFCPH